MHGYMTAIGFVPYFILAAIGFELPIIGPAALDASFGVCVSSPTRVLFFMIAAAYLASAAYLEIKGNMPIDVFCYSHLALVPVILYYQIQVASPIAILFWSAPQGFALWSLVAMLAPSKMPTSMM